MLLKGRGVVSVNESVPREIDPKTELELWICLARIERDQVGNGDEIVLLGAGEAKRKLYEVRLDPQYWYDKAIERG